MGTKFEEYCARQRRQYGDRFNPAGLAEEFRRYYNSGERVRVRFGYGEELTGTIGVTTGWQPCFLLMRTSRSIGSSYTLSDRDQVIAAKRWGRTYVPILRRG